MLTKMNVVVSLQTTTFLRVHDRILARLNVDVKDVNLKQTKFVYQKTRQHL